MVRLAVPLALLLLAPPAAAEEPAPRPGEVRVYLRDGTNVLGVVVERGDEELVLETREGARVRVAVAQAREVVRVGPPAPREGPPAPDLDPARFRYLLSPSALPLPRGTVFLSAAQPAQVVGSYAVRDWLSVSAGGSVPVAYADKYGGGLLRLEAGWSPLPWLHGQAGLEAQLWSARQVGFVVGEVTVGRPSLHVTVHGGPSPLGAARQGFGDASLAVAGLARVRDGVAILGESWVRRGPAAMDALAIRLYSRRLSADLGAVRLARGGFMPWLGLSLTPPSTRDLDL